MDLAMLFTGMVGTDKGVLTVKGIRYENRLWLATIWVSVPEEKMSKPTRMIRFDNLEYVELQNSVFDYQLTRAIPKSVLDGESDEGYEMLQGTQIPFGIPDSLRKHH